MDNQKETATTGNSDRINCPHCNARVHVGNFCTACARKMVETCNCWQVNRTFNCGHNECPTIGALLKEFGDSLFPPQ